MPYPLIDPYPYPQIYSPHSVCGYRHHGSPFRTYPHQNRILRALQGSQYGVLPHGMSFLPHVERELSPYPCLTSTYNHHQTTLMLSMQVSLYCPHKPIITHNNHTPCSGCMICYMMHQSLSIYSFCTAADPNTLSNNTSRHQHAKPLHLLLDQLYSTALSLSTNPM